MLIIDFKSLFQMVFIYEFQIPWVMYSSKDFHIQTSFLKLNFWVDWPIFKKVRIGYCFFRILLSYLIEFDYVDLDIVRKEKTQVLKKSIWLKQSKCSPKPCKCSRIVYFPSLSIFGVMRMRWWVHYFSLD